MHDHDRFKLHHGPYVAPGCKVGDKVACEYRGREVVVGGLTDALIQWPYRKGVGRPSCILFGDLIRAVQVESEIAVAHHWGVSTATVGHWRRALEVPRTNEGTLRLAVDYTPEKLTPEARDMGKKAMSTLEIREKLRAAKVGKPLHPNMVAAQLKAVSRPRSESWKKATSARMKRMWEHPEEHGLPPSHRWTDEEIALLGTDYDSVIAQRLGVASHIVEGKRVRLGIPGILVRWSNEEISILGTKTDREIAARLEKETSAVRRKRQSMGIPPFVLRWTDDEIALLGTDTDGNIAEKLGRTKSAIETKRMSLAIPSFRKK